MNTYTEILKELQTFRGGEFVPQHSDNLPCNRLEHDDRLGWIYCDTGGTWSPTCDRDAHAHIELAAWKAVREWCDSRGHGMFVFGPKQAYDRSINIHEQWIDYDDNHRLCKEILGTGPDDATALLAAVRVINGGEARNMKERAE